MRDRLAKKMLAQLCETSSRSALYWQIPEHAELWYFPQLITGYDSNSGFAFFAGTD